VLHRHPEARWTRTPEDITRLVVSQKKLLDRAATLVGKGGCIVYSTCSLEPEENHLQIQDFLATHTNFEHAGCGDVIPQTYVDSRGFLSITPCDHGMDGMFAARLRKIAD
jgi:16S rRNA (cytosine967-C5)-methyltransferase